MKAGGLVTDSSADAGAGAKPGLSVCLVGVGVRTEDAVAEGLATSGVDEKGCRSGLLLKAWLVGAGEMFVGESVAAEPETGCADSKVGGVVGWFRAAAVGT